MERERICFLKRERGSEKFFSSFSKESLVVVGSLGALAIVSVVGGLVCRHYRRHRFSEKLLFLPNPIYRIDLGSDLRLHLRFSSQLDNSLKVVGDKRALSQFIYEVEGDRLHLYTHSQGAKKGRKSGPLDVFLSVNRLDALTMIGNSRLDARGENHTKEFALIQCGGNINSLHIEADRFAYTVSGEYRSDIAFSRGVLNLSATGKGYSHLDLSSCSVVSKMSGDSSCTLAGSVDKLSLHLSGKGEVLAEDLCLPIGNLDLQDDARASFAGISSGDVALYGSAQLTLANIPPRQVLIQQKELSKVLYLKKSNPL